MAFYKTKAPSLPLAQPLYDSSQQEQLLNALRLYFNRLDLALLSLADVSGGYVLSFPHASFNSSVDQHASADDTPQPVTFDVIDYANGVTCENSDEITFAFPGRYRVQFSMQTSNTDTQAHDVYVWLSKNGTNIDNTSSLFEVNQTHGGHNGHTLSVCEFLVDVLEGDYVQIVWAADQVDTGIQDGIFIEAEAASVSPYARPATPAAVTVITFVSSST